MNSTNIQVEANHTTTTSAGEFGKCIHCNNNHSTNPIRLTFRGLGQDSYVDRECWEAWVKENHPTPAEEPTGLQGICTPYGKAPAAERNEDGDLVGDGPFLIEVLPNVRSEGRWWCQDAKSCTNEVDRAGMFPKNHPALILADLNQSQVVDARVIVGPTVRLAVMLNSCPGELVGAKSFVSPDTHEAMQPFFED